LILKISYNCHLTVKSVRWKEVSIGIPANCSHLFFFKLFIMEIKQSIMKLKLWHVTSFTNLPCLNSLTDVAHKRLFQKSSSFRFSNYKRKANKNKICVAASSCFLFPFANIKMWCEVFRKAFSTGSKRIPVIVFLL
jgi:hypothetical protein